MNLNLFVKRIILIMSINLLTGVFCCCAFAGVLLAEEGNAQTKSIREVIISLHLEKAELKTVLDAIEQKTPFRFSYLKGTLATTQDHRISLNATEQSVAAILETIAQKTGLVFKQVNSIINVKISQKQKEIIPVSTSQISPPSIIEGKVTDEIGEPLAGVNILIKGTSQGTTTDIDGNYRLLVEEGETVLIFSFIGYNAQEVNINGRTVINILLAPDLTSLQEVTVNAGYWEVDKREMTGNISRVTSKEIEQQQINNPLQALQGRVPGVYIQQTTGTPGGAVNIQIRGQNSLRTFFTTGVDGNTPLYVIDGVPFSFQTLSSSNTNVGIFGGRGSDPLNAINPADIESIEILKDADATAIYGSRGANGVVLITTKKGRAGKTKLDINLSSGFGSVANKLDLMNTQQYLEMRNEGFANEGLTPGQNDHDINGDWDQNRYTDWQEELIGGTANITNAQISLSGGNSNTTFLFSGTYRKQTNVFPGDFRYLKGSGHMALNHISSNRKLTANFTLSYTAENNNQVRSDLTSDITLPPNAPALFNEDGSLNWENSTWTNPLAALERTFEGRTYTLTSNSIIGYEIIPGLKIRTSMGLVTMQSEEILKMPSSAFDPARGRTSANATAIIADGNLRSWIIEPQINWKKGIGLGELDVVIGTTFQDQLRDASSTIAIGFPSDALIGNIPAASTLLPREFDKSEYRYNAIFARINYNWEGKYIINLTGRRDGSSRFGPGKQFTNFGAIGAAWIFSNEAFIQNSLPFLSFGKLRASYGTTGNDQIGNYEFLDTYQASKNYQGTTGLRPTRLFNPDFAWELNRKFEASLNLGFLKDRILLSGSYYHNRSSNQLVGIPLPATTGFNSITGNLDATIQNTGVELEITTINIKSKELEWNTSFNLTIPRNKLISFPGLEASTFANIYAIGKPLSIVRLFSFQRVDPDTGVFQFQDFNEDGEVTENEDMQSIKDLSQDYFGGINNKITWRSFQLEFFFQFVKQEGFNLRRSLITPGAATNQPLFVLDRWQSEGDIANIQRFSTGRNRDLSRELLKYRSSDAIVSDASFIRLQNISLSYTFPNNLLPGVNGRMYIQGQNLFTITDYEGLDPENQSSSLLPPLRILTLGVQLTL
ncbi:MAG: SusC/RagA family TonB-linked outer membrane protein [Cytophagales bacterium]|nr:SusC/RagA family TonB-linked outer membrane protein [Cytophagales bacterium]